MLSGFQLSALLPHPDLIACYFSPYSFPSLHPHCPLAVPQTCFCIRASAFFFSFHLECSFSDIHMVHLLTSFRFLLKCDLLREAFHGTLSKIINAPNCQQLPGLLNLSPSKVVLTMSPWALCFVHCCTLPI